MKYILTLTLGLIISITCSGQKVKSITSEILWEDGIWYKLSKTTNTYDASSYLTLIVKEEFDFLNYYTAGFEQTKFTINSNGKTTESLNQIWNTQTSSWDNVKKIRYVFTSSGNVDSTLTQTWENNTWENLYRCENSYNVNDSLISESCQLFMKLGGMQSKEWSNSSKSVWYYDLNGNIITDSILSGNLEPKWVSSYVYDNQNKLQNVGTTYWDIYPCCSADSYFDYEYDSNGFLISKTYSSWDWQSNSMTPSSKILYTNDSNGNVLISTSQSWRSAADDNDRKTLLGTWEDSSRKIFEYTGNTGVNQKTAFNVSAFPNPTSDAINITVKEEAQISITDLKGKLHLSTTLIEGKNTINVHHLPSTLYFISITQKGQKRTIKFNKI